MDFRQLQYYKEIVKQGNISKAAEVLNIAQPPLSQLLKKLEEELGTTLIHRYRQKWELTETGELLFRYADQVINQMDEVRRQIQEIEDGVAGTVRIGVSSACSNMLIDYIAEFRDQSPQIKIHISTGDSEGLLKMLQHKEIDIALLIKPSNSEQFDIQPLKKEAPILIVPQNMAQSLSTQPSIAEISELPFIMLGDMEGHSFYGNIMKAFEKAGKLPNIIMETKDIRMVVALVHRGLGISIVPRMNYQSKFSEQINIYDLQSFEFTVEPVAMKLKEAALSKAAEQFWWIVK